MNNITITVSGKSKVGKSKVSHLLNQFLTTQGFNVELDIQDNLDGKDIREAIESIKASSTITLKEVSEK